MSSSTLSVINSSSSSLFLNNLASSDISLVSAGGKVVIGGSTTGSSKVTVNGDISITDTTDSTSSTSAASIKTAGGISVAKNMFVGGTVTATNLVGNIVTTQASYSGTNPQISIANSTNSGEASILFADKNDFTVNIANYYLGNNVGSLGDGVFGLVSTGVGSIGNIFSIQKTGELKIFSTTDSSGLTTGSFTSLGGGAFAKKLYVGGDLNVSSTQTVFGGYFNFSGTSFNNVLAGILQVTNTTASTSNTTGSFQLSGGIGISNITDATSTTNGGTLTSAGGGAFAKKLYIGSDLNVSGNINMATTQTMSGGYFNMTGTSFNNVLAGALRINNTSDASSITTGSFSTVGGASVGKKMYIGGSLQVNYAGAGTLPSVVVSPSTTGTESSIAFYQNIAQTGNAWILGQNVGSSGAGNFAIFSSGLTSNIITISSTGITNFINTTDSTSITTGSCIYAGGVAITKNLNVGGAVTQLSDIRIKKNIKEIKPKKYLDIIKNIKAYSYTNINTSKEEIGFIAQELLKYIPDVVKGSEESLYSVEYSKMSVILLLCFKELMEKIDI